MRIKGILFHLKLVAWEFGISVIQQYWYIDGMSYFGRNEHDILLLF